MMKKDWGLSERSTRLATYVAVVYLITLTVALGLVGLTVYFALTYTK